MRPGGQHFASNCDLADVLVANKTSRINSIGNIMAEEYLFIPREFSLQRLLSLPLGASHGVTLRNYHSAVVVSVACCWLYRGINSIAHFVAWGHFALSFSITRAGRCVRDCFLLSSNADYRRFDSRELFTFLHFSYSERIIPRNRLTNDSDKFHAMNCVCRVCYFSFLFQISPFCYRYFALNQNIVLAGSCQPISNWFLFTRYWISGICYCILPSRSNLLWLHTFMISSRSRIT